MIQTATFSPLITVPRGTTLLQTGAQSIGAAGGFAGSFAIASDGAVPIANPVAGIVANPVTGVVANPAAGMVATPVAGPASPVGNTLPDDPAPETARQEWAATGNGLPIPILAGAAAIAVAWQPADRLQPLATYSDPSTAAPVEVAAAAAIVAASVSAAARPASRAVAATARQAPGTPPRPASGALVQDGDASEADHADEAGEAMPGGEAVPGGASRPSSPPTVGIPQDAAAAPVPPAALPAAVIPSDADDQVSKGAEPIRQAPSRPRSARRAKPAASPAAPPPGTAAVTHASIPATDPSRTDARPTALPVTVGPTPSQASTVTLPFVPMPSPSQDVALATASEPRTASAISARPASDSVTIPSSAASAAARISDVSELSTEPWAKTEPVVTLVEMPVPEPVASLGLATPPAPRTSGALAETVPEETVPDADPDRMAKAIEPETSPPHRTAMDAIDAAELPAAGVPDRAVADAVLAGPRPQGSIRQAPPPSDNPLVAASDDDGPRPAPVPSVATLQAATGEPAPNHPDVVTALVPDSPEPTAPITGEPEFARVIASSAQATMPPGAPASGSQSRPIIPARALVPPPAVDGVRASGIAAPTTRVAAENPAPFPMRTPRRAASQVVPASVMTPSQPTISENPSILGSPARPTAPTNPLVRPVIEGAPVPRGTEATVGAQTVPPASAMMGTAPATGVPLVTAIPRWVATEATTPIALSMAGPEAVQPQRGTVASAAQVFGAAIQAATNQAATNHAATKARDGVEKPETIDAASLSAGVAPAPQIVTAAAQQAPLDMRQERWPHAMIERIETIRDAADATDTRIRLIPDALGAIDVSVKTDGDTVRIHFNAEQAATRTLLADAQPRLAELAEARGLKLGAPGEGGAGGNGSGQQRTPASQTPNRTTSAAAVTAEVVEDTRIA